MARDWKQAVGRFWIWPVTFGIPLVGVAIWVIVSQTKDDSSEGQGKLAVELTVGFHPTPQQVVERMLEAADVKKDDVVYDLGCGDARIVVTAAKTYGCKAVGIEIDPHYVQVSNENVKKNQVEKLVTIEQNDIFLIDLRDATVVALYLLPEMNARLIPQLQQLKPGSRIVCHNSGIKGIKPKKTIKMSLEQPDGIVAEHTIYLYVAPLEKGE